MMDLSFTIFLVDDDPSVCTGLSRRLRMRGFDARAYSSAELFLADHDPKVSGCVILDLAMPGLDGLELQERLTAAGGTRPIIFLSGRGDIPSSVRAMKAGAVDFLTKPARDEQLLAAIDRARCIDAKMRHSSAEISVINDRMATLTPREREVLGHVLRGRLSKQIAGDLGTVEQTIKVHRRRIMEKLSARNILELERMMQKVGVSP
jgi:FixJ family two-component response regulator